MYSKRILIVEQSQISVLKSPQLTTFDFKHSRMYVCGYRSVDPVLAQKLYLTIFFD